MAPERRPSAAGRLVVHEATKCGGWASLLDTLHGVHAADMAADMAGEDRAARCLLKDLRRHVCVCVCVCVAARCLLKDFIQRAADVLFCKKYIKKAQSEEDWVHNQMEI